MSKTDESRTISFPEIEEKILDYWNQNQIFEKSIDPKKKNFSFYDGPPFATGLPHYGHLLASTLKDIIPRYWTMRGYQVPRQWGWDCHGLPIEQEIDKKHRFQSTEEIENFGIANYNKECRAIVLRYTEEWKRIITRLGRWADFDNAYRTMDRSFMESVWWVFKQLWDQDLIYRGHKVMQFSTSLGTPLSNFEASSNYMEVQDPAITVTFPLKKDPSTSILAWTTTPWTLPSNLCLAVGKDIEYATIKTQEGYKYIVAEKLLDAFFKPDEVEVLEVRPGSELVGLSYEALFPYFRNMPPPAFSVVESEHVTTESGTGVVHLAPGFGEDDFYRCQELGIDPVCPVDKHGRFTDPIVDYKSQFVKDADKQIIADLKEKKRLVKHDTIQHSYPFCPRTDTPLIARAVSSWFVKVESIKNRLIENNRNYTHWVPEHLRDGRFGKWLENARDWAISRNRYWGNPLPVFEAYEEPEETREYLCIGSIAELEEQSGRELPDIHREYLDDMIITKNGKKFRRVPEVLDCWFESGAMPYAQYHYPFENRENFESRFPADFIGEGLDQTRGWFYTLLVLGTILFDRPPFNNVVVNGLILAEDGKKMSKRLKNYPDPVEVMNKHGADALRLYMIDSPALRAEELRFSEAGVRDIVRRVQLKWWNAYSFFESYAEIDAYQHGNWTEPPESENILDRWTISRFQSLLLGIEKEMQKYHLYNVVPAILQFIDELTNTYIRLNRPRFWDTGFSSDKRQAYDSLHYILLQLSKVMAPFTPFLAEHIYRLLTHDKEKESVHLDSYPLSNTELIDTELEEGVALMEDIILQARHLREQKKVKVKIPLKELIVIHRKPQALDRVKPLENYLLSELNVKRIRYRSDEDQFVHISLKPNAASLGPRAGKRMKEFSQKISQLSHDELYRLYDGEKIALSPDFEISIDDVKIQRTPLSKDLPIQASYRVTVALDPSIDHEQKLEGMAREVVSRIQKLRKESGLELSDRIALKINATGELEEAIESFQTYIQEQTLATEIEISESLYSNRSHIELEGQSIEVSLEKVAA